ncbi:MAG: hypothetical protein J1D87_07080 [Lachnospiraceae bacterium]|nr:hypothetical protein [Lachnospiraceae bacterium]
MISVISIWLYMMVTTFLLGYGILTGITYLRPYRVRKWSSYLICGFAGAAVYAQFFSIFAPVGLSANLILIGICLIIVCFCRKKLWEDLQLIVGGSIGKIIFTIFLFLLYAYGTSRGIIHYDTGLYHAQSIRWIEEYGVVKGLGNLHCRLAYNSASFALSALYSMAFITGQSYHCAAGFLALIVAFVCSGLFDIVRRKYIKPSDFARVMGIYYLFNIFDEMISPASDYFMVLTAFYIIISFMDLLEAEEKEVCPYAMLCVLGVFLMTVKLSAALIILLVIKPAAMLIKEKRWKEIAVYLFLGILVAAPFLIRNVVISGWLVYPFTGIDIFSVDWKIPEGIAAYDAKEIQVWGRGYSDVAAYDMPVWKWLPAWYKGIGGMDRMFVPVAFIAVIVFAIRFIRNIAHMPDKLLVEGVVSLSFIFWIVTSPLIRYGCVYVYLTSAVVLGDVFTEFMRADSKKILQKICIAAVGVFLLYKTVAFGRELVTTYVNGYWLCQKDYDNYETLSYEIEGITFYYPAEGDRVGYESFPSSPVKVKLGLRGHGIEDGFYSYE